MKYAFIITLMTAFTAQASLKVSGQANLYDQGKNTRPQAGLTLYQPLMKHIALNSWAGVGIEPFDNKDDVRWSEVKAQLDFINGKYTLSPGMSFKDISGDNNKRSMGFVKLEYQLF